MDTGRYSMMLSRFEKATDPGRNDATPAPRSWRALQVLGAALLVLSMFGCSISTSISDSVSSPFKWSSSSLESRTEAYQGDVRDYAEAYAKSSTDMAGFKSGLGSIAGKHGITNWEADEATYVGIGEGLAKAKITEAQYEVYKANLTQGDAVKAAAIQKGYTKDR